MNKKDYKLLAEAYDNIILNKEFSDESEDSLGPETPLDPKDDHIDVEPDVNTDFSDISNDDMKENEMEKQNMIISHLQSIRSHAHEINTCIENGANIDPWMQDKITLAKDYIVRVADTILYR